MKISHKVKIAAQEEGVDVQPIFNSSGARDYDAYNVSRHTLKSGDMPIFVEKAKMVYMSSTYPVRIRIAGSFETTSDIILLRNTEDFQVEILYKDPGETQENLVKVMIAR